MNKKSLTIEIPDTEALEQIKLQSIYSLPDNVLLTVGSQKIAVSIFDLESAISDIKAFNTQPVILVPSGSNVSELPF
jgi:hypothetical protein